jgi:transcriptional regulator with XRE-family HTH domain
MSGWTKAASCASQPPPLQTNTERRKTMSKRNKIALETAESRALLTLRSKSRLSVRKLAELMGLSKTRISQMEIGRDNISDEYLEKFLTALKLSIEDWEYQINKKDPRSDLRSKCQKILSQLAPSKLEKAYEVLTIL